MQRYIRIPLATDADEALCGGCPHAAVLSDEEAAGYLEPGEDKRTTVYVCSIFRQGSMRRRLQVLRQVRPENRFDLARLRECRAVETVEVSLEQLRELGKQ